MECHCHSFPMAVLACGDLPLFVYLPKKWMPIKVNEW
jgi:hypothetical protein